MQSPLSDVDPSFWSLSSSYGTAAAFSGPVAYRPRASFDLSAPPAIEQTEALFDRLFLELIEDQECAPPENTTGSVGNIHFDLSKDVSTGGPDLGFCPLGYSRPLESAHQSTTQDTTQPWTPSSTYQDLSSNSTSPSSMSVPSSPVSSPSPAPNSASSSPPRSPPSCLPHSAGKRSVTQPSRNAQMPSHTKPHPAQPNECRYCHCRFGRRADAARHEKTHFVREYQYACLGVPIEDAGPGGYDAADIANGFVHEGKVMVHGCLTTFKDRRDSYRRHLATRGCPGSKAGYWANMKEVEAARAKRKANGY